MGFDVHGLKPKLNKPMSEFPMMEKYDKMEDKWPALSKNEEERKLYWKERDEFDKSNVGNYFRNNCWWWRPLWHFICSTCEDILTKEEMDSGNYNDGCLIDDKRAKQIAERIEQLDKEGIIAKHQVEYEATRLQAEEENKNKKDNEDKNWAAHYPFYRENVLQFAKFAKESGGFEIW